MPYRDDAFALETRRAALEEELECLQQKARELRDVERTQSDVVRELEALKRTLGEMNVRKALPVLDAVRIAAPCSADWASMKGDDKKRFCGQCEKHVYNLSAMSREDGERLLGAGSGEVCVRLYRRADGTVITSDCPVGVRRRRFRKIAAVTVGGGMLAVAAAWGARTQLAWRFLGAPAPEVVMGAMYHPPEPALMGTAAPSVQPAPIAPPPVDDAPKAAPPR